MLRCKITYLGLLGTSGTSDANPYQLEVLDAAITSHTIPLGTYVSLAAAKAAAVAIFKATLTWTDGSDSNTSITAAFTS